MTVTDPPFGPELDRWLDRLAAEGFPVGLRERLLACSLLARLTAAGELPDDRAERLRLLGPLLCSSPDQQRRYAEGLETFVRTAPGPAAERPAPPIGARSADQGRSGRRRRFRLAALSVALLLALAIWLKPLWLPNPDPSRPDPSGPIQPVPEPPPPPETAAGDPIPKPIYVPPRPFPLQPAGPPAWAEPLRAGLAGTGLLAAVGLLVWAIGWRRRRLYLQDLPGAEEVEEYVLTDAAPVALDPPPALVRPASRGLRQRIAGDTEVFDPAATLLATIRQGGALAPRYRAVRRTPEYLALIDRRGGADHLALYQEVLVRTLAEHGVALQVFHFEGSPAHDCRRAGGSGRRDRAGFAQLAARYGGHRLLVFADAHAALDPLGGHAAGWTRHLGAFPHCAWFTPIPAPSWGAAEDVLDRLGFLVLPAQPEALGTLADWLASERAELTLGADWPAAYPARLRNREVDWAARQYPPPDAVIADLLRELRDYLGARRFQWLCACAVFPALSPPLTLALGRKLAADSRELALGLAALGVLPWFRYGRMPAWLREALVDRLSPAHEALFRDIVEQRLAEALLGPDGPVLTKLTIRRRLRAWFRQGKGLARDQVLVDFLHRGLAPRLAQRLPEALKKLLFRRGQPLYGPRPGWVAGAAGWALLALAALPGIWERLMPGGGPAVRVELIGCPAADGGVDARTRALADRLAAALESGELSDAEPAAYHPATWEALNQRKAPEYGVVEFPFLDTKQGGGFAAGLAAWLSNPASGDGHSGWTPRPTQTDTLVLNACPPGPAGALPAERSPPGIPLPETVAIPAGRFTMGCSPRDAGCDNDEKPAHEVRVAAFEIGKYEVTFDEWDACEKAGACPHADDEGWGRGRRPVINVSWEDAQTYIRWLNRITGRNYRLPTEAEWEYAARAGTATPYSTGACLTTDQANYDGNYPPEGCPKGVYRGRTVAVGSLNSPNPWGLHDVHGNVWEWVEDCWHADYQDAPDDGSAWTTGDCVRRVLRGGSWFIHSGRARSAYRDSFDPGDRDDRFGFRLVPGRAASGQAGR
jgi:formylglycine-generating enzyme required for sulfatase activity